MTCILDTKKYKEEIIGLWQSCFGDEPNYISFFLDGCPHISIGYFSEDKLVSMLFLLDGYIGEYKVKYLYAACTDEQLRGRGIMAELIRYAEKWCIKNDYDGIFLVPAEDSLYSYYARFGFEEGFFREDLTVPNNADDSVDCDAVSVDEAAEIRMRLLKNTDCFYFNKETNLYTIKEHIYCGGQIFYNNSDENETLIFFCKRNNKIFVKEILSQKPVKKLKINRFFKKYSVDNIYIRTPLVYNNTDIGVFGTKCGMCLPINPRLKDFISERKHFYAGMYLD